MQSENQNPDCDPAVGPLQRTGHLIMDGQALNPKTSSTGLKRWRGSEGSWSGIVNETGHLARHLPLVATLLLASLAAIALVAAVSVGIGDLSIPLSTTFFARANRMERTAVEIKRIRTMTRNYRLRRALMADFAVQEFSFPAPSCSHCCAIRLPGNMRRRMPISQLLVSSNSDVFRTAQCLRMVPYPLCGGSGRLLSCQDGRKAQ